MLRLRVNWSGLNQGFSVMHFLGEPSTAQASADALSAFLDDLRAVTVSTQQMRVDPEVSEVDEVTGNIVGVSTVTTATMDGENATAPVPQAAQALFRWRTGYYAGGREIRGRTFVPGLAAPASSATGELLPATADQLAVAATALVAASALGVWSPARGRIEVVTSSSVWGEFAVMRSRRE